MQRTILLLLLSFALGAACFSQGKAPTFGQYPEPVEKARAKSINFEGNPGARTFRTRLSDALRRGVNFAGHYIVAGWGCGTGCISGAIIDTRTGKVFWPEQFHSIGVWYGDGNYAERPVEYKKNSRLLIIHGTPGSKNDGGPQKLSGVYYYKWKNNRLGQVKFVPKPTQ